MERCSWLDLKNPKYVKYHDEEWGILHEDDYYLFRMLILEMFVAGLSFECVLNKVDAFKKAFDDFDYIKIANYDDKKINELMNNKGIIRNKLKITSAINNASKFKEISDKFNGFINYIYTFTNGKIIYENNKTSSPLSDSISKDLKKRGMKFLGTVTIYSYLQAIGVINSHDEKCFLYKGK